MDNDKEIEKITSIIAKVTVDNLKAFLSLCESPIEKLFVSNFIRDYVIRWYNIEFFYTPCNHPFSCEKYSWLPTVGQHVQVINNMYCYLVRFSHSEMLDSVSNILLVVELKPQYVIKGTQDYRVDFLLVYHTEADPSEIKIIIECDGHDYHERTKEQATRDKQRDRELTSMGYIVLRYTGSEINFANVEYKVFAKIVEQIEHIARKNDHIYQEQIKEISRQLGSGNWRIYG